MRSALQPMTLSRVPDALIRHPLPCVRCKYDLLGLEARGTCPECGASILNSLAARLDLDSDSFLPMHGVRRVATTIFTAAIGLAGGSCVFLALLAQVAAHAFESDGFTHAVPVLRGIAVGCTLLGFLAFIAVLPWIRHREFIRAHILGAGGFAMWYAAAIQPPSVIIATYAALPAAMVLLAVTPLLRDLGPRSRAYRSARATAQRIDGLLLSTGLAGGASATAELLASTTNSDDIATVLRLTAGASATLSLIGFCYLLLNSIWILRAAFRPLLTIEQAFGVEASATNPTIRK